MYHHRNLIREFKRGTKSLFFYFFLTLLLLVNRCWSLSTDHLLPYIFSADKMVYHRHPHCAIYLGHVDIHEGTSEITGDKVIIYFGSTQKITKMYAWGHPAQYSTLPDHKTSKTCAQAQLIIYNIQNKTADLFNAAKIVQDHDALQGEHLWYNTANQEIRSLTTAQKSQTTITLQPQ